MNKDSILKRIKKLAELCEETEPTFNEMMNMDKLFSQDLISVDTMYLQVDRDEYSRDDLIDIMKECNWIWKKRKKIPSRTPRTGTVRNTRNWDSTKVTEPSRIAKAFTRP